MRSRSLRQLMLVGLGVNAAMCFQASTVHGQGDPQPVSRPGGYASTELGNIYREGIGQGFTSSSLNSIALQQARAYQSNVGQLTTRQQSSPRVGLGLTSGGGLGKPFSGFSPSPTTSPYLNLFREDFDGSSDLNYNTLVRPMLQQQQFNQQVQRQSSELSRRLQSMAAQSDFNPQGSKDQLPTGHQTAFRYYSHFHQRVPYRPGKQAP